MKIRGVKMKENVFYQIKKYNLIEKGDNVLIGLSGGADSMALLHILLDYKEQIDFNIHIGHVNHGVRGEAARHDQNFVKDQAARLDLPFHTVDVDMVQYGLDKGITAEEAGRELRYGFFREIIRDLPQGKIAVAHNRNDQAETLLMRIMRGTGIDGLKGMEFISGDIIRPILGTSREDIEKYIEEKNIEIVTDATNFQTIYNRNKVRLELIPYIEENFNPNIVDTLWRLSEISAVDSDFLNTYVKSVYKELLLKEDKDSCVLKLEGILKEHLSIKQRLIRNAILHINGSLQGITEAQISNAIELIRSGDTGKEIHLSNEILIRINYDQVIVRKNKMEKQKDYFYGIPLKGLVNFPEIGYSFSVEILSKEEYIKAEKNKYTRYFDLDKVCGDLSVRNRRPGDRFIPFGMKGSKKLKDYFIDEKVSREIRDEIPIIVDKESILWVIGYRTDEKYRIRETSKNILSISYREIS